MGWREPTPQGSRRGSEGWKSGQVGLTLTLTLTLTLSLTLTLTLTLMGVNGYLVGCNLGDATAL